MDTKILELLEEYFSEEFALVQHDLAALEGLVEEKMRLLGQGLLQRTGAKRRAISGLIRYISTNEEQMRYDVFREKGYDIGSGAVEGACKYVVGKRLNRVHRPRGVHHVDQRVGLPYHGEEPVPEPPPHPGVLDEPGYIQHPDGHVAPALDACRVLGAVLEAQLGVDADVGDVSRPFVGGLGGEWIGGDLGVE